MESSIAVFLMRRSACELLPTTSITTIPNDSLRNIITSAHWDHTKYSAKLRFSVIGLTHVAACWIVFSIPGSSTYDGGDGEHEAGQIMQHVFRNVLWTCIPSRPFGYDQV